MMKKNKWLIVMGVIVTVGAAGALVGYFMTCPRPDNAKNDVVEKSIQNQSHVQGSITGLNSQDNVDGAALSLKRQEAARKAREAIVQQQKAAAAPRVDPDKKRAFLAVTKIF
jgi:hypothetical protein